MSTVRARSRQPWLWPAMLAALAIAVIAGLTIRGLYVQRGTSASGDDAAAPPGATTVGMSVDAAAHPYGDQIRTVLQRYFDAINDKDYDRWTRAVSSEQVREKPRAQWSQEFRSTQDSAPVVFRIERNGVGAMRVLMSFVSHQDVDDAPVDFPRTCVRWRVAFPFVVENNEWRIGASQTGATPQHSPC